MSSPATPVSNSKISAAPVSSSEKKKSHVEVAKSPAAPKTSQSAEKQGKKDAELVISDSDNESENKDRIDSLKPSSNKIPKKAGPLPSPSNPARSSQPAKSERADRLREKLAMEKALKPVVSEKERITGMRSIRLSEGDRKIQPTDSEEQRNLKLASVITTIRDKNKEVIYNNTEEQEAETEPEDDDAGTGIDDDLTGIEYDAAVREERKQEDASMQDEVPAATEAKKEDNLIKWLDEEELVKRSQEEDKRADDHKNVKSFTMSKLKTLSLPREENEAKAAIVVKKANEKKGVAAKKLPISVYGLKIANPKNIWVTHWNAAMKLDNIIEDKVIQWAVLGTDKFTFNAMWETKKEIVQHMAELFVSHSSEMRGMFGLRINEKVPEVDLMDGQAVLDCFLNMRLFIKNKSANKRAYLTPAQIICRTISLSIPVHLLLIKKDTKLNDMIVKVVAESRKCIKDDEIAAKLIGAAVYETYTTYAYETAANMKSKIPKGIDFSKVLSFPATLMDKDISYRYAATIKSKTAAFTNKQEAKAAKLEKANNKNDDDDAVKEIKQVEKKQKVDKSEKLKQKAEKPAAPKVEKPKEHKSEKKAPAIINKEELVQEVIQKLSSDFKSDIKGMKKQHEDALKAQEEKHKAELKAREDAVVILRQRQEEQFNALQDMLVLLLQAKAQPQPQPEPQAVVAEPEEEEKAPVKTTGRKRKAVAKAPAALRNTRGNKKQADTSL